MNYNKMNIDLINNKIFLENKQITKSMKISYNVNI